MKRIYFLLVLFLILTLTVFSQESDSTVSGIAKATSFTSKNVVTFTPLDLVMSRVTFGLERRITPQSSAKVQLGFGLSDESTFNNIYNIVSFYSEMQYRHYTANPKYNDEYHVLKGTYAAAFVYSKDIKYEVDSKFSGNQDLYEKRRAFATGGGILLGYQFMGNSPVVCDLYLGAAMQMPFGQTDALEEKVVDSYGKGIIPRFGISLGLIF